MQSKLLLVLISLVMAVPTAYGSQEVMLVPSVAASPAASEKSQGVQSLFSPRNIVMAAGAACCIGGLLFYRYKRGGKTEPPVPVGAQPQAQEKTSMWDSLCRLIASLFSSGADNASHIDSQALFGAIRSKDVAILRELIKRGVDLRICDSDGDTPLIAAAKYSHVAAVKVLLEAGANIEAASLDGRTSLHYASARNYVEAVRVLLDAGANTEAADEYGKTPLLLAADYGCVEAVQVLLDAGANMEAADDKGGTSLLWAAYRDKVEAVKVLLDAGANMEVTDRSGITLLSLAAVIRAEKVVKELFLRGVAFPTERAIGKMKLSERTRNLLEANKKYSYQHRVAAEDALEELSEGQLPRDLRDIVLDQMGHQRMSEQERQEFEQLLQEAEE